LPYLQQVLQREQGIFLAVSDYMRQVPEMIQRWVPGGLAVLGTDGFGRSDSRSALRRFFEIDAECIALAVLYQFMLRGEVAPALVGEAIRQLGIDPDKPNPLRS
jgi:pyruvate dehydrogenase E1 component